MRRCSLTRTKETGFGIDDLWLNYRLQLVGMGGEGDLAVAYLSFEHPLWTPESQHEEENKQ